MSTPEFSKAFAEVIDECKSLVDASGALDPQHPPVPDEPLASLLDQCRALTRNASDNLEPIRTIHHFACTGGTLISKCIASMPNVQLLSEVAPYSQMQSTGRPKFVPTDMIQLLRSSSRGSNDQLEESVFVAAIDVIYRNSLDKGQRLVLREHSHSKFCHGDRMLESRGIAEILRDKYPLRSIVTVRHPLDSFISLSMQEWLTFKPATLEEYAVRYLAFLEEHKGKPVFRYEDFVKNPEDVMKAISSELQLPFYEQFKDAFGASKLSGDSGRSSGQISHRRRREVPLSIVAQLGSKAYQSLCGTLGYEPSQS